MKSLRRTVSPSTPGPLRRRRARPLMPVAAACIAVVALFSACSVSQSIALRADRSGSSDLEVDLHSVLQNYIIALAESVRGPIPESERRIFDLEEIRFAFAERPHLSLRRADSPETGKLLLGMTFQDLARTLSVETGGAGTGADLLTVTSSGGETTVRFRLDRTNFRTLAGLFPLYDLGESLALFPQPGPPMSEAEYAEYVSWAMEGVAGDTDVRRVLENSFVTVRFAVPGRIVSVTGGSGIGTSEARFRIPLLRILTLAQPLELRITYR